MVIFCFYLSHSRGLSAKPTRMFMSVAQVIFSLYNTEHIMTYFYFLTPLSEIKKLCLICLYLILPYLPSFSYIMQLLPISKCINSLRLVTSQGEDFLITRRAIVYYFLGLAILEV